ncbi:MAG TPA: SulP family inorganic anion transporter [Planctomycetota bacterium]
MNSLPILWRYMETQTHSTRAAEEASSAAPLPGIAATVAAGTLTALVTLSYSLSYGALIFSGTELQPFIPAGLQCALMAAWIVPLLLAWKSAFPFAMGGPDSNATAILALMAALVAEQLKGKVDDSEIAASVLAMLAVSAVLVGGIVYAIGALRWGKLVRYLPYPVVGGFLAGTGYLILGGSFKVLTGHSLEVCNLQCILSLGPQAWLPAVLVAAALLVLPKLTKNFLVLPSVLIAGVVVFYGGLWISGISIEAARDPNAAVQLIFTPLQPAGLKGSALACLDQAHWGVLLGQWQNFLAMTVVVIITILLNATGLDLATQTDANIDGELRANGLANIVSGLGGGMVGYLSISRSLLNFKAGGTRRAAGLITAIVCLGATFLFTPLVAYFPRPVLAGLLLYLALSMLREWLWDAMFKLPLLEYLLIVAILLFIALQGLISGVGVGVLIAAIFFVYNYSRTSCIKHCFTSAAHFSNKERSREQTDVLRQTGNQARALALQGYLFFGTASEVVEKCRELVEKEKLRYLLLDFHRVQGMDASATSSFIKLGQICARFKVELGLSDLRASGETELKRAGFLPKAEIHTFPDIDRGLEWIEDNLLANVGQAVSLPDPMQSTSQTRVLAEMALRSILARDFTPAQLDTLISCCETLKLPPDTALFRRGDPADALYFLERGELSVMLPLEGGTSIRLRSFGPGTVVGEMGLYTKQPRSADVVTTVPCRVQKLSAARMAQMEKEHPDVAIAFHSYVVRLLSSRLAAANEEIRNLL